MKRIFLLMLLGLIFYQLLSAQYVISGKVTDDKGEALSFVNVFLKETLEGSSTDDEGQFQFSTHHTGQATLQAMMLGYKTYESVIIPSDVKTYNLTLSSSSYALQDVEIVASSFNLSGSSQWKTMNAVDVATTGGSEGDLYKSISTLPGTQVVGESGKLFVRGGESREAQTYIDDMHVMIPYTTTGENESVRGRYSPFLFSGMNFSLGGYDPEYAQGLSSVLPLTTKDESPVNKTGLNPSTTGVSTGGTHAFAEGSVSGQLEYMNMGPYYSVYSDDRDWNTPYQKLSGSGQFRYQPATRSTAKIYGAYDRIWFNQQMNNLPLTLGENNYYLNSTYRTETGKGYHLFGGAAFSFFDQTYKNTLSTGDEAHLREWEFHLKAKMNKRFSNFFKWQVGMESMIRSHQDSYKGHLIKSDQIGFSIQSLFTTASFYFSPVLNMELSSRLEYTTINKQWNYNPRVALNYRIGTVSLSAIAGKFTQLAENEYMVQNNRLPAGKCQHFIVGAYHSSHQRIYRLEGYYKKYNHLPVITPGGVTATGSGFSKGIDAYFNDMSLFRGFEYRASYSLNLSEREYGNYPYRDVPQYATKHNATLSLRYTVPVVNCILGVTNRFASGRPYHDPNKTGWMNSHAPVYNSLDLSLTILAHKKLIIFASASNILGRKNIYGYTYDTAPSPTGQYKGSPVKTAQNHFFYIGFFITLSGKTAYDVSNF